MQEDKMMNDNELDNDNVNAGCNPDNAGAAPAGTEAAEAEETGCEKAAVENTAAEQQCGIKDSDADRAAGDVLSNDENADCDAGTCTDAGGKCGKKRKHRHSGFIKGVAAGIVLTLAASVLYRGYIYLPVGKSGELLIKFPYYESLHASSGSGRIDKTEINRKLTEVSNLLERNYLYDENPQRIGDGMFTGLVYGLLEDDEYAAYYSASNYNNEKKNLKGSYVGIGVSVTKDEASGGVLVGAVTAGGPAEKAGIQVGDILLEADGKDLSELTLDECVDLISGEEGTEVTFRMLRDGAESEITVKRETIKETSVRYQVIPKTNIGYLSISSFTPATEQDYYAAMDELSQNKQVDGIIIDLRNNGGGDMNVALRMVDSILKDKQEDGSDTLLLKIEDKNGEQEPYYAEDGVSDDIPINILVNDHSASASEIFSGVLKDYGYEVIGGKTFGKGIVQSIYTLSDGSAVKFTTDYYLLPDGQHIHGVGIEPSIPVDFAEYDGVDEHSVNYADGSTGPDFEQDVQLKTALDNIMEQIYS